MPISLIWPDREKSVAWTDGQWSIVNPLDKEEVVGVRPLMPVGEPAPRGGWSPMYLTGDSLQTLEALRRTHSSACQLAYLDAPRIQTNAAKFAAADEQGAINTWLTLVHRLIRNVVPLMSADGVIAILCGMDELPYVGLLLSELGPSNHIGTAVWQKNYSPRNMPNMKDLSPTHDNIVFYAVRKNEMRPVALRVAAEGFGNPDADPRGPWKAEQKGANKPDCSYDVNVAPYRYEIVGGEIPPGIWRLNPQSGVIWAPEGALVEEGTWRFTVEVTDKVGAKVRKRFSLCISKDAVEPIPCGPSWLIAELDQNGNSINAPRAGGPLRIVTKKLPAARLGAEYSACVEAEGGEPFLGTTRPGKTASSGEGRYWEFPETTLCLAAAQDRVDFKKTDGAIPALKKYAPASGIKTLNQMTTWFNAKDDLSSPGYSQDAKKELEYLKSVGVTSDVIGTAKPLNLAMRIVALFSEEGETVVDIGSPAAEVATAAIIAGRKAIYVELPEVADTGAPIRIPRLRLAARGNHPLPAGARFGVDAPVTGRGQFIVRSALPPLQPDATVRVFHLGEPGVFLDRRAGVATVSYDIYPPSGQLFLPMLASLEGLLPTDRDLVDAFAESRDGRVRAVYVHADTTLDSRLLDQICGRHSDHLTGQGTVRVYFHKGEVDASGRRRQGVDLRRVPFDLRLMAGVL